MAITGTKSFTVGEVLTAANVNRYLMRGVKVFDTTTDRDNAYGGAGEPTLEEGECCYINASNELQAYSGSSWVKIGPSTDTDTKPFNTRQVVTATNASWPVPTLTNPIVRVSVIGGGGGGGDEYGAGTAGGTTTFASGEAFSVAAAGGAAATNTHASSPNQIDGVWIAGNGGMGGGDGDTVDDQTGKSGYGGEVRIAYCDLTGKTTLNLIIGAGGTGAGTTYKAGDGGDGLIIVEYAS